MQSLPYWKRPERWLAFILTTLGVCSLLAITTVSQPYQPSSQTGEASPVAEEPSDSFLDHLRAGATSERLPGHWTSLLPPMLAVLVAAYFRSMVAALLTAFFAGSFLLYGTNPIATLMLGVHDLLLLNLTSRFSLYIFLFLFSLVGMVHVMSRNGGLAGLVETLQRFAKGPRRAKVTIGLAGLIMFFDDYANTVVVGSTMQKLSDKWKISREKLAYLVDSTTAPVAGLALLSTWIAFEAMLLGNEATNLGIDESGYGIFIQILPMRFYCIGTLVFLFFSSSLGRDYGPMLRAETRAATEGKVVADDHEMIGIKPSQSLEPENGTPKRWINALAPIAVVIFSIIAGILVLGGSRMEAQGNTFEMLNFEDWREAFGATVYNPEDENGPGAMPVLFFAAVLGGAVAIVLSVGQGILSFKQSAQAYVAGMPTMWMAIFILLMTWAMQSICSGLETANYLVALLGDRMPLWSVPLLTFLVAASMSFSIGSSWGAMGILIPMMLPLAFDLGAYEPGHTIIFYLTAAAILDGAIFGDHCSPISDTTVLSSMSSGCDHIAHVNTQLIYAATTMCFSGVLGYLAVAKGLPLWVFYVLFPLATLGTLFGIGKKTPRPVET